MRIPVTIDRVYAVPPAEVLQAVRNAAEWRESAVPKSIRSEGLLSLEAWMDPPRFRLQFYEATEGSSPPVLSCRVAPHPEGTRLIATCGRSPWVALVPGVAALLMLWTWVRHGRFDAGMLPIVLVLGAGAGMYYTWLGTSSERQARYMLDRFEAALAPLPRVTPPDVVAAP